MQGILLVVIILSLTGMFWQYILKGVGFVLVAATVVGTTVFCIDAWNTMQAEKKHSEELAALKLHDKRIDCKLQGTRLKAGVHTPISYTYSFVMNDISRTIEILSNDEVTRLIPTEDPFATTSTALLASTPMDDKKTRLEPLNSYDAKEIRGESSLGQQASSYAIVINRATGRVVRVWGNKSEASAIVTTGFCPEVTSGRPNGAN